PHSPFCIPITTVLAALSVAHETREVPNWDRRAILGLTGGAYYQVPVLVHDGRVLFESSDDRQVIPRYIDRTWAGGRLFPAALYGVLGNLCWNDWNRLSEEQDALAQWRTRLANWRFPAT